MISVGASGTNGNNGGGPRVSVTVNSSASGSTFFAAVRHGNATTPGYTITDNKGNNAAWAQIGSAIYDGNTRWLYRYQCVNGNGGSSHTITATAGSGTPAMNLEVIEITGASGVDQSNTNVSGYAAPPFSTNSVTVTPLVNGEILIAEFSTEYFFAGSMVITEANGFTIAVSQLVANNGIPAGCLAYKIVTSNGTYNANFSDGDAGSTAYAASIDSFKSAATTPHVPRMRYDFQTHMAT